LEIKKIHDDVNNVENILTKKINILSNLESISWVKFYPLIDIEY
jgi:hypothetical protein